MTLQARVSWQKDLLFKGESGSGARITLGRRNDGTVVGPSPMEMVLLAAGGCTAIDVIEILKKMRISFDDLQVEVRGERTATHPKIYRDIELVYIVTGKDLPRDRVEKAVELSQEKYCSVAAMLKRSATLTWRVVIRDTAEQ